MHGDVLVHIGAAMLAALFVFTNPVPRPLVRLGCLVRQQNWFVRRRSQGRVQ